VVNNSIKTHVKVLHSINATSLLGAMTTCQRSTIIPATQVWFQLRPI